ncbi:hypothetical protein CONPUDRAFT_151608 [Coniophora puteana RWD-64-598 SS2]|uniref:Uncharacterized protein n=1 Tax=Coniophora puteana (strain RWD-64-598) TaxID=741705 RepID=A0A5M3N0P0_CONPW|nr:uncharacterized protein CONPUDRAFT_151608 [Coniophora puteana RWD-64-598 SS2]EIW84594.1 hypothetical protein CONPUDRAFT_151608 [Coniophora puteana RWD-64-598 SS2]
MFWGRGTEAGVADVSPDIICAFSYSPPDAFPLFPRLEEVTWRIPAPDAFSFLRVISGPSLTTLDLSVPKIDKDVRNDPDNTNTDSHTTTQRRAEVLALIAQLGAMCPRMKSFQWADLWHALADIALEHAMHLRTLRKFNTHLPIVASNTLGPAPRQENDVFPGLQGLCLKARSYGYAEITSFLDSLPGRVRASTFEAHTSAPTNVATTLPDLIKAISRRLDSDTLACITITGDRFYEDPRIEQIAAFSVTIETLRPLLGFHNVENAELNFKRAISLVDEDLLETSQSWPKLRALRLNPGEG